jgi:hypothetical protein
MRTRLLVVLTWVTAVAAAVAAAQSSSGPYKVLKSARVGGEGGWDYIYADAAGRQLYIPRRGTAAAPATEARGAAPAIPTRLTVFDLDTLAPVGEIAGVGGNGTAVDPKSGQGFTSGKHVPEQGVADGTGTLYVVMQDMPGSVTVVDVKTMKATARCPFGDKGRCNGLALDADNRVLFAACANSGNLPADPPQPI